MLSWRRGYLALKRRELPMSFSAIIHSREIWLTLGSMI